jgi:hypothetical protein
MEIMVWSLNIDTEVLKGDGMLDRINSNNNDNNQLIKTKTSIPPILVV